MSLEAKQPKAWVEKQPYLLAYGFGISLFSPTATVYQLTRLNPKVKLSPVGAVKLALRILPHQTFLKYAQMVVSTPVKEYFNPWAAFCVVGMLQGGVYGQANIFFARELKIGVKLSYAGLFRGFGFAGLRDMISQGVPYTFASTTERVIFDKILPKPTNPLQQESDLVKGVRKWGSVLTTSVCATYMSQGLQNLQITMQTNQNLNHLGALKKGFEENGLRLLYRGAEARVGLLLVVNVLNELVLKKAWE